MLLSVIWTERKYQFLNKSISSISCLSKKSLAFFSSQNPSVFFANSQRLENSLNPSKTLSTKSQNSFYCQANSSKMKPKPSHLIFTLGNDCMILFEADTSHVSFLLFLKTFSDNGKSHTQDSNFVGQI